MKTSLLTWKMLILATGPELYGYKCYYCPSHCLSSLVAAPVAADTMNLKSDWLLETIFMFPIKICHGHSWL